MGGWPSTSRTRGAGVAERSQPALAPPSLRARTAEGLATASTAVADPSPSERRSSPRRAWSGPSAPPSRRCTNPRTPRNDSSNASHGLRSRHWVALGRRTWPPRHAQRPTATCAARQPAGRDQRVQQRETERGQDRGGPQVGLDPFHDRGQSDELPRRMQLEQLVDEGRGALDRREPFARPGSSRLEIGVSGRAPDVVGLQRCLALLRTAALVAADRASIVAGDGPRGFVALGRPGELVRDEHPAARRTARGEQVADRHLEARFAAR